MKKRPRRITEKRRERISQTLNYRRMGLTYAEISKTLEISETQAREDVELGMREIIREPAEEILARELDRLDRLTVLHFKTTMNPKSTHKAICDSTDRLLRIMDRRAKYLGLDNPTRVEVSNTRSILDQLLEESQKTTGLTE